MRAKQNCELLALKKHRWYVPITYTGTDTISNEKWASPQMSCPWTICYLGKFGDKIHQYKSFMITGFKGKPRLSKNDVRGDVTELSKVSKRFRKKMR